jgi:hypothetical protein
MDSIAAIGLDIAKSSVYAHCADAFRGRMTELYFALSPRLLSSSTRDRCPALGNVDDGESMRPFRRSRYFAANPSFLPGTAQVSAAGCHHRMKSTASRLWKPFKRIVISLVAVFASVLTWISVSLATESQRTWPTPVKAPLSRKANA